MLCCLELKKKKYHQLKQVVVISPRNQNTDKTKGRKICIELCLFPLRATVLNVQRVYSSLLLTYTSFALENSSPTLYDL